MKEHEFFARLWDDYTRVTPQARSIFECVEARFGKVTNDHVAFRTFDRERVDLEVLERAFFDWGYKRDRPYEFPTKHLEAYGYVPPSPELPLIFLSQIKTAELNEAAQAWVESALDAANGLPADPAEILLSGRLWPMPDWEDYQALHSVSPYLAWLSVWGFRANHFTVAVHELPSAPSLFDLVEHLEKAGYVMNDEGGVIKGTREQLLEQAATLAEPRTVEFSGGDKHEVPSCYYEFARRYEDAHGKIYQGFVAASANDIFESTTYADRAIAEGMR